MENTKKTMSDFLEMDGNIAFNLAVYNRFSSIEDSCYSEICGGFIEGVYQWADHNICDVTQSENAKYIGYTIAFNDNSGYGQVLRRVYIERWVMNIVPKNWKHAKSMFNKFLKEDVKFNQAQRENTFNTGA
jgi:hypothetical protein